MPYKRIKDKTNLIAQWKVKTDPKYYFHVFLWKDQDSYFKNTPKDVLPNEGSCGCAALSCSMIEVYEDGTDSGEIVFPKLGEIHFIKDNWDMNVVSHECLHMIIHRIRMLRLDFSKIIEQEDDCEEDLCYMFGDLVDEIYRKLWEINPGTKWNHQTLV